MTNVISALEGKDSEFIKYEYSTYKAVFDDVKVFKVFYGVDDQTIQNIILIGVKGEPEINQEKEEEYKELLNTEIKDFTSDKSVITDDYAPIGD